MELAMLLSVLLSTAKIKQKTKEECRAQLGHERMNYTRKECFSSPFCSALSNQLALYSDFLQLGSGTLPTEACAWFFRIEEVYSVLQWKISVSLYVLLPERDSSTLLRPLSVAAGQCYGASG